MNKIAKRCTGIAITQLALWGGFWITSPWQEGVYEWYKVPTVLTVIIIGIAGFWMFMSTLDG